MSAAAVAIRPYPITVLVHSGPSKGQTFQLEKSPLFVGREAENDLVFAHDSKMSRRHAEFVFENGRWLVRNLSSKNPLFVNGIQTPQEFLHGLAIVGIGETELHVSLPNLQPTAHAPVTTPIQVQARPGSPSVPPQKNAAPRNPGPRSAPPRPQPEGVGGGLFRLLIFGVLLAAGVVFFLQNQGTKNRRKDPMKTLDSSIMDQQKSEEAMRELEKKKDLSPQFQMAQEQFMKGFRDYRQGQYALAINSFSAALSLYPGHDLARKYHALAKRKFDEKVDNYMIQGDQYRGKNNFRLCRSSYESVMIMVKVESDKKYQTAKQFRDYCASQMEGKF